MPLDPKIYEPIFSLQAQLASDNMTYQRGPTGPMSAVTGPIGPTGATGPSGPSA